MMFETWSSRGVEVMIWDVGWSKGVPLLPLYTRGAGLHDGVLVSLQGRSPSWITTVSLDKEGWILSLHRWKLPIVLRSK